MEIKNRPLKVAGFDFRDVPCKRMMEDGVAAVIEGYLQQDGPSKTKHEARRIELTNIMADPYRALRLVARRPVRAVLNGNAV
jgi:hypothetical protein